MCWLTFPCGSKRRSWQKSVTKLVLRNPESSNESTGEDLSSWSMSFFESFPVHVFCSCSPDDAWGFHIWSICNTKAMHSTSRSSQCTTSRTTDWSERMLWKIRADLLRKRRADAPVVAPFLSWNKTTLEIIHLVLKQPQLNLHNILERAQSARCWI